MHEINGLISFNQANNELSLDGFSSIEHEGRWTAGDFAKIIIPTSSKWPDTVDITIDLKPFVRPDIGWQSLSVKAANGLSQTFRFTEHLVSQSIIVTALVPQERASDSLELAILIEHPGRPSDYDMWPDNRLLGALFQTIRVNVSTESQQQRSSNPYQGLPAHQFWRKAISAVETHRVDPVISTRFKISPEARVGTAGSCFAQHISRRIMGAGFNYYVTEDGASFSEEDRKSKNFGVFSARYGNIYTPEQLLQLHLEAFGERIPAERAWQRSDGRFVDPFRQQIQPEGFDSAAAVLEDREIHLRAVRDLLTNVDVFVFTLGLTEAWRSKEDGSVFSAAPGVVGGSYNKEKYEFVNFGVDETYGSLSNFLRRFHKLNPTAKVLLTVSPVPLIATYEPRSVLVSTVYSKSVLRVAADMAFQEFDWVDYFPSYEIITGSFSGGLYYENDWREINSTGVSHAMRCFMNNYIDCKKVIREIPPEFLITEPKDSIICDEEIMDQARA